MNSFAPRCWLDRPMPRSYSISMPGVNVPARVVSGASCQERRADPIVVLSLISTGWRTGAGGAGTCEHAPKSTATAAARTTGDVSGVEGFGIVFSPSRTRSGVPAAACDTAASPNRSFHATQAGKVAYNCAQSTIFRYLKRVPGCSTRRPRQANAAPQRPDLPLCGEGFEAVRILGQADVRAPQPQPRPARADLRADESPDRRSARADARRRRACRGIERETGARAGGQSQAAPGRDAGREPLERGRDPGDLPVLGDRARQLAREAGPPEDHRPAPRKPHQGAVASEFQLAQRRTDPALFRGTRAAAVF